MARISTTVAPEQAQSAPGEGPARCRLGSRSLSIPTKMAEAESSDEKAVIEAALKALIARKAN